MALLLVAYRSPADVLWRHADFILRQDEVSGAEMFIKHHEMNSDEEKCQAVVAFLQQYPVAKRYYLEHLVDTRALQVSNNVCSLTFFPTFIRQLLD